MQTTGGETCLGQITAEQAIMCGKFLQKKYVVFLKEDTCHYPVHYWVATNDMSSLDDSNYKHVTLRIRKELDRIEV